MATLTGKKVLIVIASRNFRDEEFERPYETLKKAGADIRVASTTREKAIGALGRVVIPDALLGDCRAADYDAVVFVGGPGASELFDNAQAHALARDAMQARKIVAAICVAPAILANAGVLQGRKAACFPSVAKTLAAKGASVQQQDVVRDGNLITASGPRVASEFAQAIVKALE